ncbi:pseudouridine synthase [Paraburkholderia sp. PGU19]|uniref:pseudouridine synthase n=1 Tax=Paraburkholderia sp. PGU19 TaxID=2735434 RepID=UPI0015DA1806|nr:pseudouridine synthase [Paraburkholderia sp. PGU19]
MRVKLTAKHPRPSSSERTPVRPGSTTARKTTRPAAPAKSAASKRPGGGDGSTGASATRRGAAASGEAPRRAAGKPAGGPGERPARAAGAGSRERSDSSSFERRSTGDRPARKEGAVGSGGFRRDAGDRAERRAPSDRPSRGAASAGAGERAPRFSRDGDERRAPRAPREGDERRSASRFSRDGDERRAPRAPREGDERRSAPRFSRDGDERRAPRAPREGDERRSAPRFSRDGDERRAPRAPREGDERRSTPRFSRDGDERRAPRAPREGDERRSAPRFSRDGDARPAPRAPRDGDERRSAPRFSRDGDERRAPRAPRNGDERRSAPRFSRDGDARPAPRAPREGDERRTALRERSESPRSRFGADRDTTDRRPRSDAPEARGERTYAKPVKSAYASRTDDAPAKAAPRAVKAKHDPRSLDDSFDRPAQFDRAAPKPARKARPEAAPRHRDEGEFNDAPGNLRLSKLMSELGLCSRREADEWIEKGWVTVDGVVIDTLGTKVRPDADIQIDPAAQAMQMKLVTILIHKPVGLVSGQAEDGYEPAVTLVKPENHWDGDQTDTRFSVAHLRQLAPAGRLDIDSTGLLVLTQDGRIAKQLIGGHSEIDKEYLVRVAYGDIETDVEHHFPAESLEQLRHGLELDGVPLKPALVDWQNGEQLRFVLREGKKRQIRRMCELVGLEVVGLKRVRMGQVMLGALPPGQWRYLGPDESF